MDGDYAKKTPNEKSNGVELQSLERGLRVLKRLCEDRDGVIATQDLLAMDDMPRTTAYRVLRALKSNGFLEEGPRRGTFTAGPMLVLLGGRAADRSALSTAGKRVLKQVVAETRETAFITVRSGDQVLCLEREESPDPVRLTYERGRMMPLHAGCSAKLILAYCEENVREEVLCAPLERYSERTVTDPGQLRRQLDDIVRLGYAISYGETDPGTAAVCVPIFTRADRFVGGLTIAGPDFRVTESALTDFLDVGRRAAADIGADVS